MPDRIYYCISRKQTTKRISVIFCFVFVSVVIQNLSNYSSDKASVTLNVTTGKIVSSSGSQNDGADLSPVEKDLNSAFIIQVIPANYAFCAVTDDGKIISWGIKFLI